MFMSGMYFMGWSFSRTRPSRSRRIWPWARPLLRGPQAHSWHLPPRGYPRAHSCRSPPDLRRCERSWHEAQSWRSFPVTRSSNLAPTGHYEIRLLDGIVGVLVQCMPSIPNERGWSSGKHPTPMSVVVTGALIFTASSKSSYGHRHT